MKRQIAIALFATLAILATARQSFADASCVNLMAQKHAQAGYQWWNVEMTIHREDVALVEYSAGHLAPDYGDNGFTGSANQLFSDRMAGYQPFNINAADQLTLSLSATGVLHIHYMPWNFDTQWDLSCSGPVVSKRVPGVGVVTLTFRSLFYPIQ